MIAVFQVVLSPVGPAAVLFIGALAVLLAGRWVRRPGWLTGLALLFVAVAVWLFFGLRTEPVVPTFSRPWQPPLQQGTNLLWVGDGWNWYISGLILLLGGIGILLDLNQRLATPPGGAPRRISTTLAVHLGVLGAGMLFVGSGNLLTTMLTWVALDMFTLVRGAAGLDADDADAHGWALPQYQAKGLSLVGALLLLAGLLPAGPQGPSQALQGGSLPPETTTLMFLAALIRAGIYPFHLWLLPSQRSRMTVTERLLDHMVPVLCGLWLLGWTVDLAGETIFLQPDIVAVLLLSLLASAVAGWTAKDQANHTTFVLITSAGTVALSGVLAYQPGPAGLIWPTTAFALGGALWLVGDQVWQLWRWQVPVSVGALALAGVPFTPGFLNQPALARLLVSGPLLLSMFVVYVAAQSIQVAAMLRSWGDAARDAPPSLQPGVIVRLLAATVALGLALAVVGFFPLQVASLASIPDVLPPMLGRLPNVVAEWPVWVTLGVPLVLGIGLAKARPSLWEMFGGLFERMGNLMRLEWLLHSAWWAANRASEAWGSALSVVEGAGYFGWTVAFVLMGYLLVR